ncbi:MAG: DUF1294 domain-containing protein [Pseudomonadota bacterium]
MGLLLGWLAVINVATFAAFADDKRRAVRRDRRIPERTLLAMAALGGSPGALAARQVTRHKSRKQPFVTWLFLIVAAQAAAVGWMLLRA